MGSDLDRHLYLQMIRNVFQNTTGTRFGNLDDEVYLKEIRNAILGYSQSLYGDEGYEVFLQQFLNALLTVATPGNRDMNDIHTLQRIVNNVLFTSISQGGLDESVYLKLLIDPTALNNSLYAFWRFENDWLDATGRGNTLTPAGGAASPTFLIGKFGYGLKYVAASSQFASHVNNADLSVGDIDFTLQVWTYLTSYPGLNQIEDFITKVDSAGVRDYRLYCKNIGATVKFGFYVCNSVGTIVGQIENVASMPGISLNRWYHVLAWHDSIKNKIFLQINGGTIYESATTGPVGASAATVRLGANGAAAAFLDGGLDEVGYWKRLLTTVERNKLWGGGNGINYPFDLGIDYTNVFMLGDSKTIAAADTPPNAGYLVIMQTLMNNWPHIWWEAPTRYAVGGIHMDVMKANLPGVLAGLTQVPQYVLINMGVTDMHTGPYIPLPATFLADYGDILDMLHTKWPNAKIYMMRVWKRLVEADWATETATINDLYIPILAASRSPWCRVGPDERIFLENGDDGATLTTDGVHPNHAGYIATANAWKAVLEY